MTLIKDGKYEKEISDPKLSVDKSIDYRMDLQTLRDKIVREYRKSVRYVDHGWVVLEDESLAKLVLETFADQDKRNIMIELAFPVSSLFHFLSSPFRLFNELELQFRLKQFLIHSS